MSRMGNTALIPLYKRGRAGFTLLELLVVISVISVVTGIGVQMFGAVGSRQKTQEIRLALADRAALALDSIRRDVSQVVSSQLGGQAIVGESHLEETRRAGRVPLEDDRVVLPVQQSPTPDAPAERRQVTYSIVRDNADTRLTRTVGLLGAKPGEGLAQDVLDGVMSMRIEYFDGAAWQRTWTGAANPQAIRVSLVVRDANRPFEQCARTMTFPIRVN